MSEAIKVVIRCRPMNENERKQGIPSCVTIDRKNGVVITEKPVSKDKNNEITTRKTFTFDAAYDEHATQLEIYNETAKPIVESVIEGYNGTIFCYGQTGAGKTHTMVGVPGDPGIIPNAFKQIFSLIDEAGEDQAFLVRASMLEIYKEKIRDLLDKNGKNTNLKLKEAVNTNGTISVKVDGLQMRVCKTIKDIESVLTEGNANRTIGRTNMNLTSSRSHSIFTIMIETGIKEGPNMKNIRMGKLNLVDLAGSERQSKTKAEGVRLEEACKINLSLSALCNVISALVDGKSTHIPYRDSKLTRLLQDSLGGSTKTVMVCNISPSGYNYDETLSSLRYASRAKKIKNKPVINGDPKDALLKQYQDEIEKLKKQLESTGPVTTVQVGISDQELQELMKKAEEEKQKLVEDLKAKSEEEKKKLLIQKERIEREQQQYLEQLEQRRREFEKEKQDRAALEAKLKELEAQVVKGGKSLLEINAEQMRRIKQQKKELEEQKRKERELQREVEAREEERLAIVGGFNNIQEEIRAKTKKLNKLIAKLKEAKQEIQDLQEEYQQQREDYLFTIRKMERELKLKQKIIDNFIPPEEAAKILNNAVWDEEQEKWVVKPVALADDRPMRPQSAIGLSRPTSVYARMESAMGNDNPRFKHENIINLELELPERTTHDYARIYHDDEDLEFESLDDYQYAYYKYGDDEHLKKKRRRPRTSGRENSNYTRPKSARGHAYMNNY